MKIKFSLLLAIGLLLNMGQVMAHALWIETDISGKKGHEQEIKIYYGEYAEGMIEEVADWYSDVKEFKLWLVAPDGQKTELDTEAAENHFKAKFTPKMEGIYWLQISHSAKDLGGKTVYQFNTASQVWVGKKAGEIQEGDKTELALLLVENNTKELKEPLKLKVLFKGKPAAGVTVAVAGPTGWSKNFETDENGEVEINKLWKGQYLVEAFYTEEVEGMHYEAPYEAIWRCATQSLKIGL